MEAITVYTLGSRLLKNGSTGADVKALQELLNQLGAALDVDGQFGSKTESAVKAFQKKAGIKQDGKYGYKLEHQGRTNKKNQQVRDLVIDEDEAIIVREIFDLLTNHGYGTNRVAQYLNGKGIKTKNGTTLWRGTSIRSLIDNPIYIGIYHMQGVQSEPFDHLKIIDEDLFMRCQQTVKARSTKNFDGEPVVFRTDTRSLLTGIIFCGHCGCRLCYEGTSRYYQLSHATPFAYRAHTSPVGHLEQFVLPTEPCHHLWEQMAFMVLPVHALDPDRIGAGPLPFGFSPHHFQVCHARSLPSGKQYNSYCHP